MSRILALLVLVAFLIPVLPAQQSTIPQGPWTFDVDCGKIKPVSIQVGVDQWKTWWYVVFKVTNKTGAERSYNTLVKTNTDTRVKASAVMRPALLRKIQKKEGKKLVNLIVPGKLDNGATMYAVVILDKVDRLADKIHIRVQGLASYLYKRGHKVYKEIKEFRVTMDRKGDEYEIHRNPVRRQFPRWKVILREKIQG